LNTLSAGDYTVVVTDASGCTITETITVAQANNTIAQTSTVVDAACAAPTGSIDLSVSGGTAPYTYAWTGPAGFTSDVEDPNTLVAGSYTVIITDANGCTRTATITVGQINNTITQTSTVVDASCAGGGGSIDLAVSGGKAPTTYSWTGPAGYTSASEDINDIAAGDYTVTITDASGCTTATTITVGQANNTLTQTSIVTDASC